MHQINSQENLIIARSEPSLPDLENKKYEIGAELIYIKKES